MHICRYVRKRQNQIAQRRIQSHRVPQARDTSLQVLRNSFRQQNTIEAVSNSNAIGKPVDLLQEYHENDVTAFAPTTDISVFKTKGGDNSL